MSLPLIGYELTNGQNKLIALSLMLTALLLFKNNRMLLSSLFFNLALTIYVPLFTFAFYFIIKGRLKFLWNFTIGFLLVFLILPSVVLGFDFNIFLLKDWFARCLKPFFMTTSYATYIDLRTSSHSIPSAIGRLFVSGHTGSFTYILSPVLLHILTRLISTTVLLFSCLAAWKNRTPAASGLVYAVFLILALLMPQYCIYYTWSWLFAIYFMTLAFIRDPKTPAAYKKLLLILTAVLFAASWLISIHFLNRISLLFWATFVFWAGLIFVTTRKNPNTAAD